MDSYLLSHNLCSDNGSRYRHHKGSRDIHEDRLGRAQDKTIWEGCSDAFHSGLLYLSLKGSYVECGPLILLEKQIHRFG